MPADMHLDECCSNCYCAEYSCNFTDVCAYVIVPNGVDGALFCLKFIMCEVSIEPASDNTHEVLGSHKFFSRSGKSLKLNKVLESSC